MLEAIGVIGPVLGLMATFTPVTGFVMFVSLKELRAVLGAILSAI